MADIVDVTNDREEVNLAHAVKASRKPTGPLPNGRCHFCDEIVNDEQRFCDTDCRDGWEREQRRGAFR